MTQEEKELLLKDLCGRLSCGVVIQHPDLFYSSKMVIEKLVSIDRGHINDDGISVEFVKPYLRPRSSMTEEELYEWTHTWIMDTTFEKYDWLNKKHFDYRGLIPMGLALEAPEGMYSKKTCGNCPDKDFCSQSEYVMANCCKLK